MGNNISGIPPEAFRIAAMETRLQQDDVTLAEVESMQEELFLTKDKTKQLAMPLFELLERKKSTLLDRQIVLSKEIFEVSNLLEALSFGWNYQTPEEIAENLAALAGRISPLVDQTSHSPWVQKVNEQAQKRFQDLYFEFVFPFAKEILEIGNGERTFFSRMKEIAERICEENSLEPLNELSPVVRREVLSFAQFGGSHMSPEGVAHAVENYLEALQHQARTAQAFLFGRIEEGMEWLLELPENVRLKIDQLVWDAAGGEALDPTDDRSAAIIAGAIMRALEERTGIG